jgi:hypothetical protein
MRFETPHFGFDLPDGYRQQEADSCTSFVHDEDRREITVATMAAKEEADIDWVVRFLAEQRLEALEKLGGLVHATPVTLADRGHLRESSFLAVGADPILTFCGNVIDSRPLLGQRHVVMFCCYQYFRPGAGAPDAAAFETMARELFASVVPVPQRDALDRAAAQAPAEKGTVRDPSRLYPYPVPRGYLDAETFEGPEPSTIGHDIYLALAEDFEGAAAIHYPERLGALGDRAAVVALAQANLARAAGERKVTIRGFEGPRGQLVMLFGFEWLAASCLLLPDLHAFAARTLGGEGPFCAAIPHREAMFVFRDLDASYRQEMRAFIAQNEKDARKPLTGELFAVTPAGIEPLG